MSTTNTELLIAAYHHLAVYKGFTLNRYDVDTPVLDTYVVGGLYTKKIQPEQRNVAEHILDWVKFLPDHIRVIGGWEDSETGIIYLDGISLFITEAAAEIAAEMRNEIAYGHIDHNGVFTEIRLEA